MPEFRGGPTMHLRFILATGTVDFVDQYRNVKLKTENDMIDSTAGTVQWREFIQGLSQWTIDTEVLLNGTQAPIGTQDIQRLRLSSVGTIFISPFGTAVGQMRYGGAFLTSSIEQEFPYDDLAVASLSLQGTGTLTEGNW